MTEVLWILLYVGLFYFMFRYGGCCGGHASRKQHGGHGTRDDAGKRGYPSSVGTAYASEDPVCGMAVSEGSYRRVYKGREYRFCSKACLARFDHDAEEYAVEERRAS